MKRILRSERVKMTLYNKVSMVRKNEKGKKCPQIWHSFFS